MPYNPQQNYQRNKSSWTPQSFDFDQGKYAPFRIQKANYRPSPYPTIPTVEETNRSKKEQQKLEMIYNNQGQSMSDRMVEGGLDRASIDHLAAQGYTHDRGNIYTKDDDTPSWYETIGNQLGSEGFLGGLKGWIGLGTKALDAYTGYKQVGLAQEQNQLGRDAFSFQKAAWNKDYDARKIAYNTNARDVNAWKAAQTPGGYVMSELVV